MKITFGRLLAVMLPLAVFSAGPYLETRNYRQKVMMFCFKKPGASIKEQTKAINPKRQSGLFLMQPVFKLLPKNRSYYVAPK